MNNQTLLKISLIISILGILILLILANTIELKQIKIKEINIDYLDKKVKINGKIINIKTYSESNFQVLTVSDSTGNLDITLSKPLNFTKNQTLAIIGTVNQYKDNIQIQAEKITDVN